ncbi:MAG: hypothetical protein QXU88_02340 [Candidatus Woesearchaeota archaeon]
MPEKAVFQFVNIHQLPLQDRRLIYSLTSLRNKRVDSINHFEKEIRTLSEKLPRSFKYTLDYNILLSWNLKRQMVYLAFLPKAKTINVAKRYKLPLSSSIKRLLRLSQEYVNKKWKLVDKGFFLKNRNKVRVIKGATWFVHKDLIPYQKKFSSLTDEEYRTLAKIALYDKSSKNHYLTLHILQFCPDKEFVVKTLSKTVAEPDYEISRISSMFLQNLCRFYPVKKGIILDLLFRNKLKWINDALLIALRNSDKSILKELSKTRNYRRLKELSEWKCFYISRYASLLLKKVSQ